MIEIRKYRRTRFWAVYVDGSLLAVVVYRKGAEAVAQKIRALADVEKDIRAAGKAERAA